MVSDLLLLEFDEEAKKTRKMLERVPMKEDYKPHAKPMPLGKLAPHVAELPNFGHTILTTPEFDFGSGPPRVRPPFESPAQLVRAFDEGAGKVRDAQLRRGARKNDRKPGPGRSKAGKSKRNKSKRGKRG